jgi:hypothetical protein
LRREERCAQRELVPHASAVTTGRPRRRVTVNNWWDVVGKTGTVSLRAALRVAAINCKSCGMKIGM